MSVDQATVFGAVLNVFLGSRSTLASAESNVSSAKSVSDAADQEAATASERAASLIASARLEADNAQSKLYERKAARDAALAETVVAAQAVRDTADAYIAAHSQAADPPADPPPADPPADPPEDEQGE